MEAVRKLLEQLKDCCDIGKNPSGSEFTFKFTFNEGYATTTIRAIFDDRKCVGGLLISHIMTLPIEARRRGFGTRALVMLVDAALRNGIQPIETLPMAVREWEGIFLRNVFTTHNTEPFVLRYSRDKI